MRKILYLAETDADDARLETPLFLKQLEDIATAKVTAIGFNGSLRTIWKVLSRPLRLGRYDVVITTSYTLAFAVCLRRYLLGMRGKHVAVGLNLSRRSITSRYGPLRAFFNRVFAGIDLAVVHSVHEASQFADLHDLPEDAFAFAHWGYDIPREIGGMFDDYPGPYVCMIGRNNRDHATFIEALRSLSCRGVLVVPGYEDMAGYDIPDNVDIFTDLSNADCLGCQRNSFANLILVNDNSRGAGHITAVSAMHLGVLQIVSDALPLREYLVDDVNAIVVPVGDATALRTALQRALDTPETGAQLIQAGRQMAACWLSASASANRISGIVRAILNGGPLEFQEPDWLEWRVNFTSAAQPEERMGQSILDP